jgi:hypothetical protein
MAMPASAPESPEPVFGPAGTFPVEPLDEGLILAEDVVSLKGRRLVEHLVGRP